MAGDWIVTAIFEGRLAPEALEQLMDWPGVEEFSASNLPARGHFAVSMATDTTPDHFGKEFVVIQGRVNQFVAGAPLVAVEWTREDEFDHRVDSDTLPDLVTAAEAANLLGVTKQRLHQLADTDRLEEKRLPAPVYDFGEGKTKLWLRSAVVAFAADRTTSPGRPVS